jgi:hypothetical protein
MAAEIKETQEVEGPRTGHRPGRNPDEPRNSTVCFMVTEHEKATIDALSHCIHLRRSAILTEIVTRFLVAAQSPIRSGAKRTALFDFLEECQEQIGAKRRLFDSLSVGE